MVIRKDYQRPRRQAPQRSVGQLLRCPVTGRLVEVGDASGHLKAVLRGGAQSTQALTRERAHGGQRVEVDDNLSIFASKRPDLMGTLEQEIHLVTGATAVSPRELVQSSQQASKLVLPPALESVPKRLRIGF